METVAAWFGYVKPDPRQQRRKCLDLINQQERKIRKLIVSSKQELEKTIKTRIKNANRDLRHPAKAAQARSDLRYYGRRMVEERHRQDHLAELLATMAALKTRVNGTFDMTKVGDALGTGVKVMKSINIKTKDFIDLQAGMRQLQTELIKADVIEDLVDDALPQTGDIEDPAVQDVIDEVTEAQIDNAIASVLNQSLPARNVRTPALVAQEPVVEAPQEKLDEEKQDEGETAEALMEDMNHRLQALRS
ncbi:charged multivesicular body protein 3 [Magnaporthiopsis poae ATCC 64411]|uniref:Charged multivesicular body protein 3 n=1 Tax=Magnaporthiopsis poae (strain ATCC 64411 / 73-15) TaxID=644358 RepID=A0A0C4DLX9_MAGP6|nr:charged multivesicular body protein 3 [Magnaporthiopsis poae ATCC 64411]